MEFVETFQLVSTIFGWGWNTVANMELVEEPFTGMTLATLGWINSSLKKSTKICQLIPYWWTMVHWFDCRISIVITKFLILIVLLVIQLVTQLKLTRWFTKSWMMTQTFTSDGTGPSKPQCGRIIITNKASSGTSPSMANNALILEVLKFGMQERANIMEFISCFPKQVWS